MNRLSKILITFIIGIIGLTLLYFYRQKLDEQALVYQKVDKYNEIIKKSREEKEQLQNQAKDLYEQLYLPDKGSTIILLSDTRVEQKDNAIAIMDEYDYCGVIALSLNALPEEGLEGYLTREDIDELLEKGYELVIKIINEDITMTYKKITEKGYEIKGFYFEGNNIGQSKIDTVKKIDPNLIIIGTFENGYNYVDDLLITAYGSAQSGVKTKFDDAVEISKPLALTVGYDNSKSQYSEDNFRAMLKSIDKSVDYDETEVCNISEAIERHNEFIVALKEELPKEMEELEELKSRIDEIDKEINNAGQ